MNSKCTIVETAAYVAAYVFNKGTLALIFFVNAHGIHCRSNVNNYTKKTACNGGSKTR